MKTNKQTTRKLSKKEWIQRYAERIYQSWLSWKGPLGVASSYIEQIKYELHESYSDPLKRLFIEQTYPQQIV